MDNTRAMKEFIDILNSDPNKAFDFIASSFWRFTKEDLRQIILELLYALHRHNGGFIHDEVLESCAENLEDVYSEYFEEMGLTDTKEVC